MAIFFEKECLRDETTAFVWFYSVQEGCQCKVKEKKNKFAQTQITCDQRMNRSTKVEKYLLLQITLWCC
jgi:hypothetical protein